MKIRHLLALAVSGLALNASAQVVSAVYDFNDPINHAPYTAWLGSDGWTVATVGGFFVNTPGGPDGITYIAFNESGAGVGGSAYRDFSAPTTSQQFSLGFSYRTSNYWGTALGVGSASDSGFSMNATNYLGSRLVVAYGGGQLSGEVTFTESWHDFRVDIDLGANGESGSATFYEKAASKTIWAAIGGLADINLGLDASRTASDDTNPLNWDTLWFHEEGADSGIDNVSVSAIPEPSTYAAMAGAAALGLAVWRRRLSSRQA